MGLQRAKVSSNPTFNLTVLVQFVTDDGATVQGDFKGKFKRIDQERIDELMDPEAGYLKSEVVEEILVGVSGISGEDGAELPPDEQLAWVKKTPECVSATVAAFFKVMQAARYDERTSKQRRSRG